MLSEEELRDVGCDLTAGKAKPYCIRKGHCAGSDLLLNDPCVCQGSPPAQLPKSGSPTACPKSGMDVDWGQGGAQHPICCVTAGKYC